MIDFMRIGLPSKVMCDGRAWLAVYFVRRDEQGRDWYLACDPDASLPAPIVFVRADVDSKVSP